MKKSKKLPILKCNISISVGTDGVWLHFKTFSSEACINVPSLIKNHGIIGSTIAKWCVDRQEQAKIKQRGIQHEQRPDPS